MRLEWLFILAVLLAGGMCRAALDEVQPGGVKWGLYAPARQQKGPAAHGRPALKNPWCAREDSNLHPR